MSSTSPRRGGLPRVLTRVGLVAALFVGASSLAVTTASAHHPEIDAVADCAGVVTFTAEAWLPGNYDPKNEDHQKARTNDRIEIDYRTDGADWQRLPWKDTYRFGPDNGYTFTDSFALHDPLPASVTVRATDASPWANGVRPGNPRETTVTVPADCPGGQSAAVADLDCADGGAKATLSNDGESAAVFTVRSTPQGGEPTSTDVEVPAGSTEQHLVEVAEDTTVSIEVLSGGKTLASREVTRNCGENAPTASVTLNCEAGAEIVLDNSASTQLVAYRVRGPNGLDEEVGVRAGESVTRTYELPEGAQATYRVEAEGMNPIERTVQRDCGEPGPIVDVVSDCDSVVLTLGNEGTEGASFSVTMPDGSVERHTVKPGDEPLELTVLPADAGGTITVSAQGMQEVVVPVAEGCEPGRSKQARPSPSLAETGASILPLVAVAAGLLLLGGLALLITRRRRAARHARK